MTEPFPLSDYGERLEALRRSTTQTLDVNPQPGGDYADAALAVQMAMHHLDEALPNGQASRVSLALELLRSGAERLAQWALCRGIWSEPREPRPVLRLRRDDQFYRHVLTARHWSDDRGYVVLARERDGRLFVLPRADLYLEGFVHE